VTNQNALFADVVRLLKTAPTDRIARQLVAIRGRAKGGYYSLPKKDRQLCADLSKIDAMSIRYTDYNMHVSRVLHLAENGYYFLDERKGAKLGMISW
jgi:hypothetical protein